ncbi:MAG TPA: hypothetical protein VIY48_20755 [Candidatus Paceibacterota bacterium]
MTTKSKDEDGERGDDKPNNKSVDSLLVSAISIIAVGCLVSVAAIIIFDQTPEDTPEMVVAILGATATVIASMVALLQANYARTKAEQAHDKVHDIHLVLNGKLKKLLDDEEAAKGEEKVNGSC